jgi:hypothetical protein
MRPRLSLLRVLALALLCLAFVGCKKKKKADDETAVTPPKAEPTVPGEAAVAGPVGLDGLWRITSAAEPTGRKYGGNVQMSRSGDVWEMNWKLSDGGSQGGIGIDLGNGVLAAGWGGTGVYGVTVYDVAGGNLTGKVAQKGLRTIGAETLSGPPGLNGTYTITRGVGPGGDAYTGTVRITPNGAVYDLTWSVAPQRRGVAILDGSKLIAGWGIGGGAGFVKYAISATKLDGVWAPPGNPTMGTEVLER